VLVLLIFFAGLLAGTVHVLAGPDHLAAVAPYTVQSRRRLWLPGAQWGAGHIAGVAIIAALAWTVREVLPLKAISAHSESLVGVVLIAIGLWTLRSAMRTRLHVHTHVHDGERHSHLHVHTSQAHAPHDHVAPGNAKGHDGAPVHHHSHAPFWVGGLHGLAGSSHLLGVLPALAFPTQAGTATYLTGYAGGTLASMVLFSVLLGWATKSLGARRPGFYPIVTGAAGIAAIAIGAVWLMPR
jgi:hypothetical protein